MAEIMDSENIYASGGEVIEMNAALAEEKPSDGVSTAGVTVDDLDKELAEILAQIPDKMAFKIGEVADLAGVKAYVLRYWETEFEALRPQKSNHNQRMYSRTDVETVMMIKKLLYKDRFSIEGARKALKGMKGQMRVEKDWQGMEKRFERACEKIEDLASDIARLRRLF